jgi:hypothetical protein
MKLVKKLIGNNEIEDALMTLDRLTREEAQMIGAQLLDIANRTKSEVTKIAHDVHVLREVSQQAVDGVRQIERSWFPHRIYAGHTGSIILTENQLRPDLRGWLSPPDPSTNHIIACKAHHKGTATWFFEGRTYTEWKSTGSESLLWIHGKRVLQSHSACLTPPNNTLICSWLRQEHTLVRRAFTVFVNDNLVAYLTPVRRLLKM